MSSTPDSALILPADALRQHWQGHRRLTRRVIDAFPDDQLVTFTIGGMRPFGAMALELLTMAVPMVQGIVSNTWDTSLSRQPRPKADINEIHHRGQGFVCLRALGIEPPPFYERA